MRQNVLLGVLVLVDARARTNIASEFWVIEEILYGAVQPACNEGSLASRALRGLLKPLIDALTAVECITLTAWANFGLDDYPKTQLALIVLGEWLSNATVAWEAQLEARNVWLWLLLLQSDLDLVMVDNERRKMHLKNIISI